MVKGECKEGTGNQENNIVAPAGSHNEDGGRD